MSGERGQEERWLSVEIDQENYLDGCDGCGMQIFDDFFVVTVRGRRGAVREYSVCTRCYHRMRDELERRQQLAGDGQADELVP